jgi:hypothetical protein
VHLLQRNSVEHPIPVVVPSHQAAMPHPCGPQASLPPAGLLSSVLKPLFFLFGLRAPERTNPCSCSCSSDLPMFCSSDLPNRSSLFFCSFPALLHSHQNVVQCSVATAKTTGDETGSDMNQSMQQHCSSFAVGKQRRMANTATERNLNPTTPANR